MKKLQMPLRFEHDALKEELEQLANDLDMSVNSLNNLILAAHFYEESRKTLDLMMQLREYKRSVSS